MYPMKTLLTGVLLVLAGCSQAPQNGAKQETASTTPSVTLFEGARVITGDGSAPLEDAVILMEDAKITGVGHKGELTAPAGAARVDLTGKTVMPALVDTHTHQGCAVIKTGKIGAVTYTKNNLIDHLHRLAYYGVAATQSMVIDPGETPYEVRDNPIHDADLFSTAGRGMGRTKAGPGQDYWKHV